MTHAFNGPYDGNHLDRTAFPLGGIGAGMICLEGNGGFTHVSVRNQPEIFHAPILFGAISTRRTASDSWQARILQGQPPGWKIMFPWGTGFRGAGSGARDTTLGLPYFRKCSFEPAFPFASVSLDDAAMPVRSTVTGWSPFIPGNSDDSSLPAGMVDYLFENTTHETIDAVFTFSAENFMAKGLEQPCDGEDCGTPPPPDQAILRIDNGFILNQPQGAGRPERKGAFAVQALEKAHINCRWFRGGWWDAMSILWKDIATGKVLDNQPYPEGQPGRGGSLAVPFKLAPGEKKTVSLVLAWHVPYSRHRIGHVEEGCKPEECYRPWYAQKFPHVEAVLTYVQKQWNSLRGESASFRDRLGACAVPPEVLEAVRANLSILKSPTVLRQHDGRIWAWEGCCDTNGCCYGSCTHVWNYAQAMAHLFPDLERSLRQTEFGECQDETGHQVFRAPLPIAAAQHNMHAAADGQLGGIMKVHRDWKISGDIDWLRNIWPRVKQSLDYSISIWDPEGQGFLVEPQHNTYDIEFWGANGMCTSFYLGALRAATLMARALGEDDAGYHRLYLAGRAVMEDELFNGEYFIQRTQTDGLKADSPLQTNSLFGNQYGSEESRDLLQQEGPKYQYGTGCLIDGVLGAWMAEVCGIGEIIDPDKVKSHLLSVFAYNFRESLHDHANPQRPTYALNNDAGVLMCTWPQGDKPTLPFPYSDEVWTGCEYHLASHLAMFGETEKCCTIVQAVRARYDGRVRNPFNEYECGHWYGRALSSFALLKAFGVNTNFIKSP